MGSELFRSGAARKKHVSLLFAMRTRMDRSADRRASCAASGAAVNLQALERQRIWLSVKILP